MSVCVKLFFQKLWLPVTTDDGENVLDWDDELPASLLLPWEEYLAGIQAITAVEIPRCLIPMRPRSLEIHGFSDASS